MKRTVFFIILFFAYITVKAQVNSHPGCIVTNDGDTLRGTLELRTNSVNTRQCTFKPDSQSTYTTYKPGEIDSYIFDMGKYYITKRFEGDPNLYFAEYVVQGVTSVYKVVQNNIEKIYIVNENAETISFTPEDANSSFTSENVKERNKTRQELSYLLRNSMSTVNKIGDKNKNLTESRIISLVENYHNDVCTNGSECIVYEKKKNVDKDKVYYRVYGGFAWDSPQYQYVDSKGFTIGAGIEYNLTRVNKNAGVEAGVNYACLNCNDRVWNLKHGIITIEVGPVYRIPITKNFKWIVRGGFTIDVMEWEKRGTFISNNYSKPVPPSWDPMHHLFFGTGFGFDVFGREVSVDMKYRGSRFSSFDQYRMMMSASVRL